MDIQAEKIELIRLITEVNSEKALKKIKAILASVKITEAEKKQPSPAMAKRLEESKKQVRDGMGVKVTLDDIWK